MEIEKIQKKLQMHKASAMLVMNAPKSLAELFTGFTPETAIDEARRAVYDYVMLFVTRQEELQAWLPQLKGLGKPDCLFWVCYPKKSGSVASDLHRDIVWEIMLTIDLRAVSLFAIDDTWSAMRLRPADLVGK